MKKRRKVIRQGQRTTAPTKLSWADTARAMAKEAEDWSDWEVTVADGLEQLPNAFSVPKDQ